jgi:hypothetical protein
MKTLGHWPVESFIVCFSHVVLLFPLLRTNKRVNPSLSFTVPLAIRVSLVGTPSSTQVENRWRYTHTLVAGPSVQSCTSLWTGADRMPCASVSLEQKSPSLPFGTESRFARIGSIALPRIAFFLRPRKANHEAGDVRMHSQAPSSWPTQVSSSPPEISHNTYLHLLSSPRRGWIRLLRSHRLNVRLGWTDIAQPL